MDKSKLEWKPISGSSQIKAVYWNPIKKILYVRFPNRKEYSYEDVSEEEYKELITADSIGSYFHSYIKTEKKWQSI